MKFSFLAIFSLFLLFNCAASESVGSVSTSFNTMSTSSNSISSISTSLQSITGSISGSSSAADKAVHHGYMMDVRELTSFYFNAGFSGDFKSDLSGLAIKNGITNWEKDPSTFMGIGLGLRKSGASESELNSILQNWNPEASIASLVKKGFNAD